MNLLVMDAELAELCKKCSCDATDVDSIAKYLVECDDGKNLQELHAIAVSYGIPFNEVVDRYDFFSTPNILNTAIRTLLKGDENFAYDVIRYNISYYDKFLEFAYENGYDVVAVFFALKELLQEDEIAYEAFSNFLTKRKITIVREPASTL